MLVGPLISPLNIFLSKFKYSISSSPQAYQKASYADQSSGLASKDDTCEIDVVISQVIQHVSSLDILVTTLLVLS